MARVVGTYKILPDDMDTSLQVLKKRIEKALPKDVRIAASGERPIAFGLVALVIDINFAEQDGLQDEIEAILQKIPGISEFEALQFFRI